MKSKNIILILSALSFLLVSCTTSSPRNRGSLSGAMDKSRDDYEEERRVPDREDDEDWFSRPEEDQDDPYPGSEEELSGYSGTVGDSEGTFLLLRSGTSCVSDPYFDNPFDMEILLGNARMGHLGVFLFAGFKTLDVQYDDNIYESIKPHPFILHCGVEMRYYPFAEWQFLSPYLTGRISGFTLFWMYQNSLEAGPDTISSDYLGGIGFDGGVGVDLIKTDSFQAGVLVLPQLFLFGEETFEGFSNDVFSSYGTVRWSFEAGFKL